MTEMTTDDAKNGCSADAQARKQRTMARLRGEGVPVSDLLPCIEDEATACVRDQDQIVDRAIAVMLVAGKGERAPTLALGRFVNEFAALPKLSPNERAFWENPAPTAQEEATFSWRYEALAVLLWSLGYLPDLGRPTAMTNPAELGRVILMRGEAQFRASARRRSPSVVLDFADLMYRYHWAVRDAQLHQRPAPFGLNPEIIMEWDWAARWLVGYGDQDWDDISLDT